MLTTCNLIANRPHVFLLPCKRFSEGITWGSLFGFGVFFTTQWGWGQIAQFRLHSTNPKVGNCTTLDGGWSRILTELGLSPEGEILPKIIYSCLLLRADLENRTTSSKQMGLEECYAFCYVAQIKLLLIYVQCSGWNLTLEMRRKKLANFKYTKWS